MCCLQNLLVSLSIEPSLLHLIETVLSGILRNMILQCPNPWLFFSRDISTSRCYRADHVQSHTLHKQCQPQFPLSLSSKHSTLRSPQPSISQISTCLEQILSEPMFFESRNKLQRSKGTTKKPHLGTAVYLALITHQEVILTITMPRGILFAVVRCITAQRSLPSGLRIRLPAI